MGFAEGQESKVQMKTISLLILVTVFILGTMTKDFLIALEKEKELHADSDIDGQDIEKVSKADEVAKETHADSDIDGQFNFIEKVNKADEVAKETELEGIGLDIIGDKTSDVHSVSSDYDFSHVKRKEMGQGIFLDRFKSALWECRYRKSKR